MAGIFKPYGADCVTDCGFDLEKAKSEASAYASATGVGCSVIGSHGELLYQAPDPCGACRMCGGTDAGFETNFSCADVHLYGSYQAERFGGRYIFFCPLGLTHWAAPIADGLMLRGAFIGGPVTMVPADEFLAEEIPERGIVKTGREDFLEFVRDLPSRRTESVNALSKLLCLLGSDVSAAGGPRPEDRNRLSPVQAQIPEPVRDVAARNARAVHAAYPIRKESELLRLIAVADKPSAQRLLNEILGHILFSSGMDFEIIRARIEELTVLLSRAAIKGGADVSEIFGLNCHYLSEIREIKNFEDITFWLSNILARFTDCVFNLAEVRHKDIIYKALNYIQKNYMKKIALEEVANEVYLAPSYFSKIFKDETGCSFVAYVNKVRVDISKELLLDLSVPLTDVVNLVGFEEQSYYTKVFKKITGTTPGSYRQSRGAGGQKRANGIQLKNGA